jgi:O-antigen biosynthesis protein
MQHYQIPSNKLCVASLFGLHQQESVPISSTPPSSFHERRDFVFVGGMKHEPNIDTVRQLKRLWPQIRQKVINLHCSSSYLPPNLHVYGAFCTDHFRTQFHDPATGFFMQGYYSSSINDVLCDKRVLISPIRFGAGIKGKHIDAWRSNVPVVTTSIGSEGMVNVHNQQFGGRIANSDTDFIQAACELYNNEAAWNIAVSNISTQQMFHLCDDWERIRDRLMDVVRTKGQRREQDYIQNILWHQSNRSTEYFSKYIECKEKNALLPSVNSKQELTCTEIVHEQFNLKPV